MAKELTFKANKNDKGEIISYSTRIYLGTDIKGKAIRKRETLSVKGMNSTEAKKALKEFEKECSKIQRASYSRKKLSTEKFQNYADYVLKMKEIKGKLQITTLVRYKELLERINPVIGNKMLCEIDVRTLNAFYIKLLQTQNVNSVAKAKPAFFDVINKRTLGAGAATEMKQYQIEGKAFSKAVLSRSSGAAATTVSSVFNGNNIVIATAEKIAMALGYDVEDLFEIKKETKNLSHKTVSEYAKLISMILTVACEENILDENPAKKASAPEVEEPDVNYYKTPQINQILSAAQNVPLKRKALIYVLVGSLARRGEILGLKWNDIDLDTGLCRIRNNVVYRKGYGTFIKRPKTKKSERTFTLPQPVVDVLKEHKANQEQVAQRMGKLWKNMDMVFPNECGGLMHPDTMNSWLRRFRQKNGLPHLNPHAFRHTGVSILFKKGVPIVDIAHHAGHKTTQVTQKVYAHIIEETLAENAKALAQVFDI